MQRLSDNEIIVRAYGAHGTSDFPILTTQSGNRVLLDAYRLAELPFKRVSREQTARDFRPLTQVRFGEAPQLLEVTEQAEITHGSTAEAAESYSLKTWGRSFALSRRAIINDDLNAFGDTLRWWGRATAEAEASAFLTMLALNSGAGPTMSDTKALFHADHGNVGTRAAPLVARPATKITAIHQHVTRWPLPLEARVPRAQSAPWKQAGEKKLSRCTRRQDLVHSGDTGRS